ncbi:Flagellar synthesis regulatory protein FlaF [hydrothermal vent metagenome]|uniref:Flagellar synthesis regulatory protein FlaF n=1 Tax=hydrothermal vent metagenome TaxID=652676 RepID=A0A3B0RBX5_9ZZZZ
MSLTAYQKVSNQAETASSTEYRLFAMVTRSLMDAQTADTNDFTKVAEAVDWNRRVWGALAYDCASEDNGLPDALRAGIISLSIFINKHSSAVVHDVSEMETLIDINRMIMQGLADQAKLVQTNTAQAS